MNARDYLYLLRENLLLIAACVVACLAVAGTVTVVMPKSYSSSATFYVVTDGTNDGTQAPASDLYSGAQLAKDRVLTYTELIVSARIAEDAAAVLGADAADIASALSTASVQDTVMFSLTATDDSAAGAAGIVRAVSDSFIRVVNDIETRGTDGPVVSAVLVQPPVEPTYPTAPSLRLNLAAGLLIGLVLGFGIAVARRSMDVSVRSAEDLERTTEAAALGTVPDEPARTGAGAAIASPSIEAVANARAEAFRSIRTNLEYANVDGDRHVLVVTSAVPGEGKTTVACNLAAALAAVGARVVLVEGDLRRPGIARAIGIDNAVGLTTVLVGKVGLTAALQPVGGFDVLAGGRPAPRPNELLSSRKAAGLIDDLRHRYDFVLIDAPPVLPVSDAVNLGRHADGAVVVCRWGKTSRHLVSSTVARLQAVSVPVVGAILTRAPKRAGGEWGLYGTYTDQLAGPEPEPAPRPVGFDHARPEPPPGPADDQQATAAMAPVLRQWVTGAPGREPDEPTADRRDDEQNGRTVELNGHSPAYSVTDPSPFRRPPPSDPPPEPAP